MASAGGGGSGSAWVASDPAITWLQPRRGLTCGRCGSSGLCRTRATESSRRLLHHRRQPSYLPVWGAWRGSWRGTSFDQSVGVLGSSFTDGDGILSIGCFGPTQSAKIPLIPAASDRLVLHRWQRGVPPPGDLGPGQPRSRARCLVIPDQARYSPAWETVSDGPNGRRALSDWEMRCVRQRPSKLRPIAPMLQGAAAAVAMS